MARFHLALVEGLLEEPMARRLMAEAEIETDGLGLIVAGGCDPFWQRAPNYNKAAEHVGYVFGLSDLEQHSCPSGLIAEKMPGKLHPRFVLRIQVRELESWLLADPEAWAAYLKVSAGLVPKDPDTLPDPKRALVNLVRRCRKKSLREDIVPEEGKPRVVGPGYTTRIGDFITEHWNPSRAAQRSPSLKRALLALERVASAVDCGGESG
ncbi:MAG: DUF4276 family protein [Sumerlaeia bacterium]